MTDIASHPPLAAPVVTLPGWENTNIAIRNIGVIAAILFPVVVISGAYALPGIAAAFALSTIPGEGLGVTVSLLIQIASFVMLSGMMVACLFDMRRVLVTPVATEFAFDGRARVLRVRSRVWRTGEETSREIPFAEIREVKVCDVDSETDLSKIVVELADGTSLEPWPQFIDKDIGVFGRAEKSRALAEATAAPIRAMIWPLCNAPSQAK